MAACQAKPIYNGTDAEAFVESVMSSQRVTRVSTPININGSRKRTVSETGSPEYLDSTVKKAKVSAKRSLYDEQPTPAPRKLVVTEADVHVNRNPSIEHLITKLSYDMHMLFGSLSERMDKLESGLEQKIANKVTQLIDKRVNTELSRIRRDIDGKLDSFKDEMRTNISDELEDINSKIERLSNGAESHSSPDIAMNVVIWGLPVTPNENVSNKVNAMFKDALKVAGVSCASAERKIVNSGSKPGVVIAKMRSHEDKRKVMLKKQAALLCVYLTRSIPC